MGDPAECSGPLQLPANGRRPGKVDEEYHVRSNGSYRCLIGLALLANNAPLRACEICKYIRRDCLPCNDTTPAADMLKHVEECLSLSELFRKTTHISTVCAEDSESYWEIVPKNREKLTREVMTFVKFSGVASKEGSSCSQVQHLPCTGALLSTEGAKNNPPACPPAQVSSNRQSATESTDGQLPPLLALLLQGPDLPPASAVDTVAIPASIAQEQCTPGMLGGGHSGQVTSIQSPGTPQTPVRPSHNYQNQGNWQQQQHTNQPRPPLPFVPNAWQLSQMHNAQQQANVYHRAQGQPLLAGFQVGVFPQPNSFLPYPDNYNNHGMWQNPSLLTRHPMQGVGYLQQSPGNWNNPVHGATVQHPSNEHHAILSATPVHPLIRGPFNNQQQPWYHSHPCNMPQASLHPNINPPTHLQPPGMQSTCYPRYPITGVPVPLLPTYNPGLLPTLPCPPTPLLTPPKHYTSIYKKQQYSKANDTPKSKGSPASNHLPSPLKNTMSPRQHEVALSSNTMSNQPQSTAMPQRSPNQVGPVETPSTSKQTCSNEPPPHPPPPLPQKKDCVPLLSCPKEGVRHSVCRDPVNSEVECAAKISTHTSSTSIKPAKVAPAQSMASSHQKQLGVPTCKPNLSNRKGNDDCEGNDQSGRYEKDPKDTSGVETSTREAYSKWLDCSVINFLVTGEERDKLHEPLCTDVIEHSLGSVLATEVFGDLQRQSSVGLREVFPLCKQHDGSVSEDLNIDEVFLAVSTVHAFVKFATQTYHQDAHKQCPPPLVPSSQGPSSNRKNSTLTSFPPCTSLESVTHKEVSTTTYPSIPPGFETQSTASKRTATGSNEQEGEGGGQGGASLLYTALSENEGILLLTAIRKQMTRLIHASGLSPPTTPKQTLSSSLDETFTSFAPFYKDLFKMATCAESHSEIDVYCL